MAYSSLEEDDPILEEDDPIKGKRQAKTKGMCIFSNR